MSHTRDNTQLLKSRYGVRPTTMGVSVPPSPDDHSFLGLHALMVMQEAIGTMRPGDGLSRWHVRLSYGRNSDTILITLEERHTTPQATSSLGGLKTWWSRLASGVTSFIKSPPIGDVFPPSKKR